jgi:hypothetical protein
MLQDGFVYYTVSVDPYHMRNIKARPRIYSKTERGCIASAVFMSEIAAFNTEVYILSTENS